MAATPPHEHPDVAGPGDGPYAGPSAQAQALRDSSSEEIIRNPFWIIDHQMDIINTLASEKLFRGRQTQDHLPPQTKFGFVPEDDVYYGGPIHAHLHASDTARGYPDVYVNGEDHTVTIDPLKNAQWILPHNAERHSFTVHRGALKDHAGVMRVAGALDKHPPPPGVFVPTASEIDAMDKYTPRCTHNSTRGRASHGDRWGKLPTISQGIYNGAFVGKPDWAVDTEVNMERTHGDRTRFFDCHPFPGSDCRG